MYDSPINRESDISFDENAFFLGLSRFSLLALLIRMCCCYPFYILNFKIILFKI